MVSPLEGISLHLGKANGSVGVTALRGSSFITVCGLVVDSVSVDVEVADLEIPDTGRGGRGLFGAGVFVFSCLLRFFWRRISALT